FTAVLINAVVAGVAFVLVGRSSYRPPASDIGRHESQPVPDSTPVYVAIALSGLCALGAQVLWTRILSVMLGATVYTFSIILAVFLVGLGIGSTVGSFLAKHTLRPRLLLGCCQMLL